MKLLLLILFFPLLLTAQNNNLEKICKDFNTVVAGELNAHRNLFETNGIAQTNASSNFDVKYIRFNIFINPAVRYISGAVTNYFTTQNNADSIVYDLSGLLLVDSVKYHGLNTTYNQRANNTLSIKFATTIAASTFDSVTIFYKGVPPSTSFGSFIQTTHNSTPIIWTLSEPYGSLDWWPCKNGLDDKADSLDMIITCPQQYRASSNGLLITETVESNFRTAFYKHRYPITSYLVAFAVTNYTVFNNTIALGNVNMPMTTYVYPESLSSFQNNTPYVINAMQIFHNTFGDYPFINERYGHTQFSWGGGMEHQTNSFLGDAGIYLMAHELGHQWFGDKITCGSWGDIWLNEGFATYLGYYFIEKIDSASFRASIEFMINNISSQAGGSVYCTDTTDVNRIFSGRLSYYKGSYLLRMLQWKLGDTLFFNAIKQYSNDPLLKYKYARTSDLKRNLEQVSGQNLTEFFNDWFYGQGYPNYQLEWSNAQNGWVNLTLKQTQSHASVSFYEMPVPILFKNATQQKTIVINHIVNNQASCEYLGFVPTEVIIDPKLWLLAKTKTVTQTASTTICSSLPNESIILKATLVNNIANLSWTNSGIADDAKYNIQFSTNGLNFENLVKVNGPINNYMHHLNNSVGYYRILAEDKTGNLHYSNTVKLQNASKNNGFGVFVAANNLTIFNTNNVQYNMYKIVDVAGRTLKQGTLNSATSTATININQLAKGIYSIIIFNKNFKLVKSFLKQ